MLKLASSIAVLLLYSCHDETSVGKNDSSKQSAGLHRLLTGAVEDVSKKSGLNERFLGLIILPIAGNACEHITAIFVAVKNKMDLAIGVALGSSIQVISPPSPPPGT